MIRRRHLWEAANDIGFARQSDGRYLAYISEYDRSVRPTWHTDVVKEYGAAKAAKELCAPGLEGRKSHGTRGKFESRAFVMPERVEHCAICFTADGRAIGVYSDAIPWASLGRILAMPRSRRTASRDRPDAMIRLDRTSRATHCCSVTSNSTWLAYLLRDLHHTRRGHDVCIRDYRDILWWSSA